MIHYNFNKSSIVISPQAKSFKNTRNSKETGLLGQKINNGLTTILLSIIFGEILYSI